MIIQSNNKNNNKFDILLTKCIEIEEYKNPNVIQNKKEIHD